MIRPKSPGIACTAILALAVNLAANAGYVPTAGYSSTDLLDTLGTGVALEGMDLFGSDLLLGFGTNIWIYNLESGTTNVVGALPSVGNDSVSFTEYRDGTIHAAYASYSPPYDYTHGVINTAGMFESYGVMGGVYDAATDSSNTLYIMANPGGLGSKVFRLDSPTTQLVEVIHLGGWSGPISFDSKDRLYVGEQGGLGVLRFTPGQLALAGLTASNGTSVVAATVAHMSFDEHDRLYATTGWGASLNMYDPESGWLLRRLRDDESGGSSVGRMRWDAVGKQLVLIDTVFGVGSTLKTIGFTDSNDGVAGTAPIYQGWIAAYRNFERANTNSGGYARNDANSMSSVGEAIVGKPGDFEIGSPSTASGHVLSLGNGGSIILEFDDLIVNEPGPDFAVFENGFYYGGGTFAEYAFVEVATTTNAWARFPVTCYNTNEVGLFGVQDVTKIDGLAGKHEIEYGTPFDLEWLKADTNVLSGAVNLNQIAYVRLIDVVGDGSTFDQFGRPVYDPYDEAQLSLTDGFDLRGVGVMHHAGVEMSVAPGTLKMSWYGYAGRAYQPTLSSDGAGWSNLGGEIIGTGGVHHVTLPLDQNAAMFKMDSQIVTTP